MLYILINVYLYNLFYYCNYLFIVHVPSDAKALIFRFNLEDVAFTL